MRSKNSDWVIGSALDALFSQDYTHFELLVVDSGSTDNTLKIVNEYPCRLVEIEASDYYPGKVLNDAISMTNSDIIVFLNSDSVMLSPKSLNNLIASFDSPETAAAFGRQIPRPEAHTWVARDYQVSFPQHGTSPDWISLSLPLAAIKRSVWDQHHFYTDSWASEDTEWGEWARKNGHKVQYIPDAVTMHSHNYTLKEIYGRRFVEGEADAFIYDRKSSFVSTIFNTLKSYVRDFTVHIKANDLQGLFLIPIRRFVFHWAYFKGNQVGVNRIKTNNPDTRFGQRIVLSSATK